MPRHCNKVVCSCVALLVSLYPVMQGYAQETHAVPALPAGNTTQSLDQEVPFVKPGNVTVNFRDADIKAVLRYLSEVGGVDIVPSPDVTGAVTLSLTDKPWDVALDIIVKNYGYAYEREGNIIRVVTLTSLKLEELSTEVIPLNYATAENAQEAVKDMLTERGKMSYDTRINALIVTDLATNIYKIKRIIRSLDKKTPQIMIEARIIETKLTDTEKLGINWNLVIAAAGAARPTTLPWGNEIWRDLLPQGLRRFYPRGQTGQATTAAAPGAAGTTAVTGVADFMNQGAGGTTLFPFADADSFAYGTLDFSQFSAVLEYLDQRSDTEIISNPRITTLNNRAAKMFVGKVYNYIAEIERNEDTGGQQRFTYKIEKEEIGIRLLVTPHINDAGDIEVELKPEIKDVIEFQRINEFFSLPVFATREAETQVIVRDAETIFIGGLIKEDVKKITDKIPLLGDILGDLPFVGGIFKYKSEVKEKTELVFFLTVHVVKDLKDFNKIGVRGVSESMLPSDVTEEIDEIGLQDEVRVELSPPISPKIEKKALFDFRKKKKK